jgi:hypothetical protein
MNYELVTGLFADRLSDEVLVSDLLGYMGINTAGELESVASNILGGVCEWSVYSVDIDSLSVFKTIRGRGYMKRKDMQSLCEEHRNRANLKRALNKYLDASAVERLAAKYEGDEDEEEFIEWLMSKAGDSDLIPWTSIPEDVFVLVTETEQLIKHIEIEIDGVVDAMENVEFVGEKIERLKKV